MRRRLPFESEELVEHLTAWIAWRYATSRKKGILTSAPTSIPLELQRWMPGAVWRLVWHADGSAVLYGMAQGSGPTRYFVARHDTIGRLREGAFDRRVDGTWAPLEGDTLDLGIDCENRQAA
jgi:hypothetical protein